MWTDNETDRDFLNFGGVAKTVAEIVVQADARPVSIGVSGAWGVGKSSMIRLIRSALAATGAAQKPEGTPNKREYVFVEFNAWLYQNYDDARAALVDVIATTLAEEAEKRKSGVEKSREFLKRVQWLRLAKLTATIGGSMAAMSMGIAPLGMLGAALALKNEFNEGKLTAKSGEEAGKLATEVDDNISGIVAPAEQFSPPREIQALRDCFEKALSEIDITLVVLIDDLDRCLPETTIATLEAIRLFLFLKGTAFVIAADDQMIKHAVRRHFSGVDDDLVTNYFDKLIQVPIRVPPLGTQDVRAYMMLLFVENSSLPDADKEKIRAAVCKQLSQTWQGKRVDQAFIKSVHSSIPADLQTKLESADRIAPLMTVATRINGNPRLIKRFLNALSIRLSIAKSQEVAVNEAELAKVLLFERCGSPRAYAELAKAVAENDSGRPEFLAEWEQGVRKGKKIDLAEPWNDPFTQEWLALAPPLADSDLRGVLYVSREHLPIVSPEDRLSSEAAEILTALVNQPSMARSLQPRVKALIPSEASMIMGRLLDRAQKEVEWGTPDILEACLVVGTVHGPEGLRLSAFLTEVPISKIRAGIVPKIADQAWASQVFQHWIDGGVKGPIKAAIEQQKKK